MRVRKGSSLLIISTDLVDAALALHLTELLKTVIGVRAVHLRQNLAGST
jgi:hypothetical protein